MLNFCQERCDFSVVYFFVLISIIGLDLGVKAVIQKKLPIGIKIKLNKEPYYLWHTENKGIAFNQLEKYPRLVFFLTGGMITAIFCYFMQILHKSNQKGMKIALTFILGGALGNFINRIQKGTVTDYFYIAKKKAPIFNLADIFVVFGGIIYFLSCLFQKDK